MGKSVDWMFRMVDRVSGPASAIRNRLEAVERTVQRVESVTKRSGGAFGGWARQGEQGARRVEQAFERVNKRVSGTNQQLQALTQGMQTLSMVGGAALLGIGYSGKKIVDAAAYKQDQLLSFKGMLDGNLSRASKIFNQAQAYAAATPFTTQQVIDATRQALAILPKQGKDQNALPLVDLAAKLSAGSNKSMDQTMEAFAALLGGDFGQAFGVGQGFSNLNITREMLRQSGLRFDAQGSYKGTVQEGLNAVAKIINSTYGNSLNERGQSISGLASTLASRPQELFMSLVDSKGESRALKSMQDFMRNLGGLTDFSRPPGRGIQQRFERSMTKLFGAVFNPLADATSGQKGIDLIDRMLDKVDEFSVWVERNGPGIITNLKGFGEGFKSAADGAMLLVKPLGWIVDQLDRLSGGSGQGGSAKALGFLAGGATIGFLGNLATFGGLGKLANLTGRTLLGGIKGGMSGLLTKGVLGEILTNPAGKLAGLRAALTGVGAAGTAGSAAIPVIGWVITLLTTMDQLGKRLYGTFEGFTKVIDFLSDAFKRLKFAMPVDMKTLQAFGLALLRGEGFGGALKAAAGAIVPGLGVTAPTGGNSSITALTGVAKNLGIDPNALLAVAFKESSLNPAAAYRNKDGSVGAAGLIQFTGSTAAAYGLNLGQILKMSPDQQAPYIEKYLRDAGVRQGSSLEQIYAAVFAGSASKTGVLYTEQDGKAYSNNVGLDTNKDGQITSQEAAAAAASAWQANASTFAPNLTVNLYGPATPQAVQDISSGVHGALTTIALEQGSGGAR